MTRFPRIPNPGDNGVPRAFNPIFPLVLAIVAIVFAFAPTMKPQLKIFVALAFLIVWLLFSRRGDGLEGNAAMVMVLFFVLLAVVR